MASWSRLESILFGLTVLFWSGRHALRSDAEWTVPSISVLALNIAVGGLFVLRHPASRMGRWAEWVWALPCIVVAVFVLQVAPPAASWPIPVQGLFVVAVCWTIASLLTLGRSFSVLPAVRSIVTRGPYRLVRHPAYLGESVMTFACLLASPTWVSAALLVLIPVFVVWRIQVEERLLSRDSAYQQYQLRVRWRLLPGVW
ncbi:MAG: isoprenylcysteine carboxylmethyltransferase family protein [Planctomycetaceae bacterium]|nr:isoprenylcysteine carboxylmethyltransferase family protein [Planctomycetaceae bacterium]